MGRQESGVVIEQTFEPLFETARHARHFVREALRERGRSDVAERLEMLVGELAVNAVLHARTSYSVALRLQQTGLVRVDVCDGNTELPRKKVATGDDVLIHGRGIILIQALSTRWGVEPRHDGKCVWAEVGP